MSNLYRYAMPNQKTVLVEIEDGRGGGRPVAIGDRLRETGKTLTEALQALPELLGQLKTSVLDHVVSPSEVTVEFGVKVGADVGLIVSSSQAEANFKIKVTWKS